MMDANPYGTGAACDQNVAIGSNAMQNRDSGKNNIAIGYASMFGGSACTGSNNISFGTKALYDLTTGDYNICIGSEAGANITTADDNIAIGSGAIHSDTTPLQTVALGNETCKNLDVSQYNIAIGYRALMGKDATGEYETWGASNIAIGASAMLNCHATVDAAGGYTAGNVAIGHQVMRNVSGDDNIAIGPEAGDTITTGHNNICIGNSSEPSAANGEYQTVIGKGVVGSGNNTFTFGLLGADTTCTFGANSWSNPSDQRIKKNIKTSSAGLSFINDLNPVIFNYKLKSELEPNHPNYEEDSNESLQNSKTNHGFIAQEVKEAIDNNPEIKDGFNGWSVNEYNDYQRVSESSFIPMIVKAIQELSDKVKELEDKLNK
jgi:hypothetical protein